ncbi:uncharacterized protein LOC131663190 isoform X2 [Phymastichus coffea]|uniref:uncharacterized protein LOC131663190 isoform X2 n=1 Tax=Phymastichus coffea TaxID=108790 RepID=UPI00273A843E|nr:uncharacterized protein LOC131663190 isoform X2 [Phymastichus coffea]
MRAATAESEANDTAIQPRKYGTRRNRCATDQRWIIYFVVFFILWLACWLLVHDRKDRHIQSDNALQELPELGYVLPDESEFSVSYWGKSWIFDAVTFNVGYLKAHYNRSGSIVLFINLLLSAGLILYGFTSILSARMSSKQMRYFARPLVCFLFYYRFLMYFPSRLQLMNLIFFDTKINYWLIPELIVIVVLLIKPSLERNSRGRDAHVNEKINFQMFMGYVSVVGVTLFVSLEVLMLLTAARGYALGWDNPAFYMIAGLSCYVGLTFYHFGLMVISCATSISFESRKASLKDLARAIGVVGRVRTTVLTMNAPAFGKLPVSMAAHRLCVSHFNVHGISAVSTAVHGRNHSSSIRELLRLFSDDAPIARRCQHFGAICASFLALMIGMNNLSFTLLCIHGVVFGPLFAMGTWMMYLTVMFFNYIFMRAHDAAADTIWLLVNKEEEVEF